MRPLSSLLAIACLLTSATQAGVVAAPGAVGSLTDSIGTDVDTDGRVDRGDTIDYETVIESSGTSDAEGVEVNITLDANQTLVGGSVKVGAIGIPDTATYDTGTALVIDVLANDRDIDGTLDPATVTIVNDAAGGTTSVNTTTGEVTYTPTGSGVDSFTYTVEDNDSIASSETAVTLTLTPTPNNCPVAKDDTRTTDEETDILDGDVFADNGNGADTDAEAEALSIVKVNGNSANVNFGLHLPSGAWLTVAPDGTFVYEPNDSFESLKPGDPPATETFTYAVSDGHAGCEDEGTFTITINGVNDVATAFDDSATFIEDDGAAAIAVMANDSTDPETGETLSISAVTQGDNGGVVTITGGGTGLTYAPAADFNGQEIFTYDLSDGNGSLDTGFVTVTVTAVNDPPTATDDTATADEDAATFVIDVLANDDDAPDTGETLSIIDVDTPDHGTAHITADKIDFVAQPDFHGVDTFTYTISDGTPGSEDTATVSITIDAVNDCPVAVDDASSTDEDTPISSGNVFSDNGTGIDYDIEGDAFTVSAVNGVDSDVGQPKTLSSGALLMLNSDGTFYYHPDGAFDHLAVGDADAVDSFTYTVTEGGTGCGDEATVTITISPVNDPPSAADDSVTVDEDVFNTSIDVLSNDNSLPESGETLAITAVSSGDQGGTITLHPGDVTYSPVPDFYGTETFTYDISDGNGGTDTGEVTVTVTAVNDAPTAVDDTATVDEDSANNVIDVLVNDDSGPETGETLEITGVSVGDNGGTINFTASSVTYSPAPGFTGIETFTYDIADGNGGSDTAEVAVTVEAVVV